MYLKRYFKMFNMGMLLLLVMMGGGGGGARGVAPTDITGIALPPKEPPLRLPPISRRRRVHKSSSGKGSKTFPVAEEPQ